MNLDIFLAAITGVLANTVDMALVLGLISGLIIATAVWRILRDKNNTLEMYQFFSSKGPDGIERADIDKLGKVVGIFLAVMVVLRLTWMVEHIDAGGLVAVLGAVLVYLGAVSGYSAYLRSKQVQPTDKGG